MELSKEMKADLVKGLTNDTNRMNEQIQKLWGWQTGNTDTLEVSPYSVDTLVYITEEMRLKLKLLGGARIYEL